MKHLLLKVSICLCVLVLPVFSVLSNAAKKIRIVTKEKPIEPDSTPHRTPTDYADEVYAMYNSSLDQLSISFEVGSAAMCITVYVNEVLVSSNVGSIAPGGVINLDLSNCASGVCRIVITMMEEEEEFVGTFIINKE